MQEKIIFHKHHIIPRHMGGTNEKSNLVKVNIAMHSFLHKCLFEEHGHWKDHVAWKALSGQITKQEIAYLKRINAIKGNKFFLGKSHTEETKLKMSNSKKGKLFTEEHKEKLCRARKNRITRDSTREKLRKPRPNREKKYEIIFPDGHKEIITGIYKFIEKNNLPNLFKTMTGERENTKGYKCRKIENV